MQVADYIIRYGEVLALQGSTFSSSDTAVAVTEADGRLTAAGVGTATVTVDGKEYSVEVKPAEVDVVLFTGQSNMVGRETEMYECDIAQGMAYEYKLNSEPHLTEVINPVGETFGNVEISSGSSIVPEFCARYVTETGHRIIAVYLARGGRRIAEFAEGGKLYPDIMTKYAACLEYLEDNENFVIGRKFYVMFQGESDTGKTSPEDYKNTYMSFHNALKDAFGMEFGAVMYTGRDTTTFLEGILRISRAKYELAKEHGDIIVAVKDAMTCFTEHKEYLRADLVHFNAAGLIKIADDCCDSVVSYLGLGKDTSKAGTDPVTYLSDPNRVLGIYFDTSEITAVKGNNIPLSCLFNVDRELFGKISEPVDISCTYASGDPSVAEYKDGFVVPVGEGSTVITAVYDADTSLTAEITVRVTANGATAENN